MFEGLPVIQVDKLDGTTNKNTIKKAIRSYITSDDFKAANFQNGWNKLFMKHRRRQILKDAKPLSAMDEKLTVEGKA